MSLPVPCPTSASQCPRRAGHARGGGGSLGQCHRQNRCHQHLEPRRVIPEPGQAAWGTQPTPPARQLPPSWQGGAPTNPTDKGRWPCSSVASPLCWVRKGQAIQASGSLKHNSGFAQPLSLSSPGLPWRFGTSVGISNGSATSMGCPSSGQGYTGPPSSSNRHQCPTRTPASPPTTPTFTLPRLCPAAHRRRQGSPARSRVRDLPHALPHTTGTEAQAAHTQRPWLQEAALAQATASDFSFLRVNRDSTFLLTASFRRAGR